MSAAQPLEIRLATILPRGVAQDARLKQLEQDWRKASGETVLLRRAPGGEKDGEATIVRKLHSGNYPAALLSITGLTELEPNAAALQTMPLIFQTWAEVDYVREKIRPRLEAGLRKKGFVVLFWADSGWVNFFSVRKATSPADFKKLRMFTWGGNAAEVGMMKSLGYHPVALETADILPAFGSGMIEAAPLPPTFAIGAQITTVARHVLEINWAPIVGAAVVRQDIWDKVPADLQKRLLILCEQTGVDLRQEGRRFHEDALNTLRKGPKTEVHTPSPEEREQFQKLGAELAPKIRGQLVPAEMFDLVQQYLKEFRSGKAGGP